MTDDTPDTPNVYDIKENQRAAWEYARRYGDWLGRKPPIEYLTVEELRTALLTAEERLSLLRDQLNTALTDKHDLQRHHEQLLAAHVTVMAEVKRTGLDSPWED